MSSIRSLLAKWLGGAGASPPGGVRSLLARWVGGAGTSALSQGGLLGGGSADVTRTRSYEASGGGLFNGAAIVAQDSGQQAFLGGGGRAPKYKPSWEELPRRRRVGQRYSYVATGGLEPGVALT